MRNKKQKGFIAISTVLVVSAVVMAVALSVTMRSIGNSKSAFVLSKGEDTLALVEGCAEDGLIKSKTITYNGGTITRPEGSCLVTFDSKVGTTWTMTVTNTIPISNKRTVQVIFTRTDTQITLSSWKEI